MDGAGTGAGDVINSRFNVADCTSSCSASTCCKWIQKKFSVKKEIQSKKLEKKMFLEVRNSAFIKRTAS